MLNKKNFIVLMLAASMVLVLASCSRTPEQKAGDVVKHIAAELKLNAGQTAQLENIKDEFLARRPAMIKAREESVKEANELMRSAVIDKAKLNALVEKNQTEASDMIRFISAKFTEIHDMLTPEQREKLVSMIEKHMMDKEKAGKPVTGGDRPGY